MNHSKKMLPAYFIEVSKVFTQILEMENIVIRNQLDALVKTNNTNFKNILTICKNAIQFSTPDLATHIQSCIEELKNFETTSPTVMQNNGSDNNSQESLIAHEQIDYYIHFQKLKEY